MKKDIIKIFKNTDSLSEAFTSLLISDLKDKESLSLSLSGGTTPKALFEYWGSNCQESVDWKKIQFFWGDDRCVPADDPMSNYGVAKHILFDKIPAVDKDKIYPVYGENDPSEESIRYAGLLDRVVFSRNNIPSVDIMMLGLGDDGHTVSIFPNQIDLWDNPLNCVVAKHPDSGMLRVSMTGRVINNSRKIVFLVTGENKAEKVKQIITDREKYLHLYPAARVNPVDGELYWFLDEAAASLL